MKVLGFHIVEKTERSGKVKLYAWRSVEGKQRWVYIGQDIGKAEDKITAWCRKHGLEALLEETLEEARGMTLDNLLETLEVLHDRVVVLEADNKELRQRIETLEAGSQHSPRSRKADREKAATLPEMEALKKLCNGHGREIAYKVGVSEATIRRYFQGKGSDESKSKIYPAILDNLYPDFVNRVKEVAQRLMDRDRTASATIWEIRQDLAEYPVGVFNSLLRKMEAEGIIYFNEHPNPGCLQGYERDGSIEDDKKGLLFRLVLR